MAGESSRYLLQVDIDWSQGKQSTDAFLAAVQDRIAQLETLAGKTKAQGGLNPVEVGENVGQIELALQRVRAAGLEAGNALLPGVNEALLKVEQLQANLLSAAQAFRFTGYEGGGKPDIAAGRVEAGFNTGTAGETGANVELLQVLRDQVVAAQAVLDYEQFFARNLQETGGLAQQLQGLQAQTILLTEQRNLALKQQVEAERLQQYLALTPDQRAARPEAQAAQLAAAQRVATASVEAELAVIAETERAQAEGKAARSAAINQQITTAQRQAAAALEAEAAIEQEVSLAEAEGKAAHTASINVRIATAQRQAAAAFEAQAIIEEEVAAAEAEGAALRKRSINQQIAAAQRVATASVNAEFDVLEQQQGGRGGGGLFGGGGRGGFLGGFGSFGGGDVGAGLGQRAASSAAFFLSGVAIFAVVDQLRNAIKATGELEKEFGVIQTMLNQFGQGNQIEHIRNQVLDLSVATATSAAEVAKVERQLAGVFANQETGAPNFDRAAVETETATKFARVTGEKFTEIVDQFSALTVSFSSDQEVVAGGFRAIANDALALGQQLGVPEAEILKFSADIAPLAASLGFTAKQLEGLGAVALQASGRSASGLSEQIGRSLAGLQDKFPQLVELFSANEKTRGLVKDLGSAFGAGDIPKVLEILVANYKNLNEAQIQNLALIVGGRREAGTFYALLQRAPETLKALREQFKIPAGDLLDERFAKVADTITFQFDQAKIAVQRFLVTLLESGIGDAFVTIAGAIKTVADILSLLIGLVSPFFQNWVGEVAGVTAEVFLLVKAFEGLQKVILATSIGKNLFPGAAASAAGGAGGGFLTNAAGRYVTGTTEGLFGGGVAGGLFAAAATPLTAIIAGVFAAHELQVAVSQRDEVARQGEGVTQAALAALNRGDSIDAIRARAASGEPSGINSLRDTVYNNLFGQTDTQGLVSDAQQLKDNPKLVAELQAIQDKQGDVNAAPAGGRFGRKRLSSLISDLSNDPINDNLNAFAQQFIKEQDDPAVKAAIAAAAQQVAVSDALDKQQASKVQAVLDRLQDPAQTKALSDLQAEFAKGDAGPRLISTLLKQRVDDLKLAIDAAVAAGKPADDADVQKLRDEKDKNEKALNDIIKSNILGSLDFARKLREALGHTSGGTDADLQQTIREVSTTADQLSATGNLDPSTEQGLIFDAINALKDKRRRQADQAKTALEKDAILSSPIAIPPEIQRLITDVQLRQGPASDFVQEFSTKTGKAITDARSHIEDLLTQFGGNTAKVEETIHQEELDYSKHLLAALVAVQAKFPKKGILRSLVSQQLKTELTRQTGLSADEINNFAVVFGGDASLAEQDIVALFNQFNGDVGKVRQVMLQAELRFARTALQQAIVLFNLFKSLPGLGGGLYRELQHAYQDYQNVTNEIAQNAAISGGGGLGGFIVRAGKKDAHPLGDVGSPGSVGADQGAADQQAKDQLAEAQALENANLDIAAAQANGDAIKLAQIAKDRAAISAKYAVLPSEKAKALAEMITADNEVTKAESEYNNALRDLANAKANDDPVTVAKNAVESANEAASKAAGPIAQANAQAAQIRANRTWAKAIEDLADSQTDILIAMAEAAGDSVGAANLKLKELTDRLANADNLGLNQEDRNKLTKEIIDQSAVVIRTVISEGEAQVQTDLTLKRITKAQAIAELEALKAKAISAGASQKEIDQIAIEIQNLQGQLGQDFKFNLPSILGLPTLYEVRRFNQSGGGTGSGYQDNRVINVTVNASTNADPNAIAATVASVIGAPRTYGSIGSSKY